MAATYTLISSQVLGSSAASVTFSSIPQTYTDLKLVMSVRDLASYTQDYMVLTVNGSTGIYSDVVLYANTGTGSVGSTTDTSSWMRYINGNTAASNVFSSAEIYIPNYSNTSYNKQMLIFSAQEDNSGTSYMAQTASLLRTNSAISSITLAAASANIAINSSFYLYGIKSS